MSDINLTKIYNDASKLPYEDQLDLISKLAASLRRVKSNKRHKLSELQGLGKEIWRKIDSEQYLKELRREWNDQ
jgi:hypothetical protein